MFGQIQLRYGRHVQGNTFRYDRSSSALKVGARTFLLLYQLEQVT
jgi:hypothetical protein